MKVFVLSDRDGTKHSVLAVYASEDAAKKDAMEILDEAWTREEGGDRALCMIANLVIEGFEVNST